MKNLLTMGRQRVFLALLIYFLRSCQVSHSIGLMIDNQLVIVANDCYTRIAIGSKLPDVDVFFNVAVGSISECEDECSKRRNSCNAFAFGVGIKGNGTCALSAKMPKPEELQSHADYDVYMRSQRSPHCEPDRLYKMGSGNIGQERRNETVPTTTFGSGLFGPTMPSVLSSPRTVGNMMPNINGPSFQRGFMPSLDDERRITDIVRNKNPISPTSNPFGTNNAKVDDYNDLLNRKGWVFGQRTHSDPKYGRPNFHGSPFQNPFNDINHLSFGSNLDNDLHSYKALTVHNGPFEVFSKPIFVHDGTSKNRSPTDFGFWNNYDTTKHRVTNHLGQHRQQDFLNNVYKGQGIITRPRQNELVAGNYDFRKISSRPIIGNSYGFETNGGKISNGGFKDTSELWSPELLTMFHGFGTKITEKPRACYRRLLAGKKSLDLHVRRAIECERLEDCHRACDQEKLFTCEGFNYRRNGHGARGMCEMTSVPYSRMDFHRDFVSDSQCDYYERDPNCVVNTPEARPTWWNQQSRPGQSYGPPHYPNERPDTRPYVPDRRPLNEVPRPLDYDRRPLKEIPRPFDFDRRPSNEIPRPLDYRPAEHDRRPPTVYGYPHRGQYDDTFDRRDYPDDSIRGGYPTRSEVFAYSSRFPPRRPTDDDAYNRNLPWARYPNRRLDYDIGTNEIGSYSPGYRKGSDWDSYGTVYGGSYGYDTNYVGKFDVPKYYPKSQPKPSRPYDQFYGEFYNYGGAFGYGDNYIPASQDPLYSGTGKTECSVRAGAGFRLSRGVVRKTYLTANLDQCESLCISEKNYVCMSFSYRYNVAPTDPTDNCLLSDISYRDLNFYIDLEPDRDYDIYAMVANSRTCTRKDQSSHPPDECFWRVRSGFGMPTDVVRKSLTVDNLGECQAECMTTQDFMCRSFAFKYNLKKQSDDSTNCYLSDWPSQDINPTQMLDMDGAELYERGSFGRGCEPYAVPFFNMGQFNSKQPSQGEEVCYSGYSKPCKLTPYVVLLATFVNSEQDCRQKCSKMREADSTPCMSYSYKLTTHGTEENCLLSDVPIRDLRPGLDYTPDNDHVLYAWKDLDPSCMVTGNSPDDEHVFGGLSPSKPMLPDYSRPDFNHGRYPSTRPDYDYPDPRPFFTKPGGYGMRPYDPDRPDPVRPYPSGSYGHGGDKFGYGNRPGGYGSFYYPDGSTFLHYTVNGYPCKRGTRCERNQLAGFWACETEGGGFDSWDYCCVPSHHCGFSQGYHYPWCYVGSSEDQWRPCSEKYYPYLPSPRPIRPTIGGEDRYDRPDRPYDPGYYGRHWPITYLHREPPPNCTDSIASADNSGNRRSNETSSTTIETPRSTTTIRNDENGTTLTSKTRRRRLRVRTANDTRNDRSAIFSQKLGARIITNDATRIRENQTNWDRAGKIERVSRPTNNKLSLTTQTVASFVTTNNVDDARFEGAKSGVKMIKVPLIAPNKSLPATGA